MDFAKLVTEYMNQRTEGDPSFIVSEEALAFVDLMRADDMDRRASSVESETSSDARGEPSNESITNEARSSAVSEAYSDADPAFQEESSGVITTPASPYTDVALGGNQDAGVLSKMPEPDTEPSPASAFVEDYEQSEPSAVFTEDSPQPEPSQQVTEDYQPSEPASVFTESGDSAAPNSALQEEGIIVSEQSNLRNETTILAPQSMPDFESLLQSFDRDYHPPDPPAGDLDLIPAMQEEESSEPLQNTTEFCEVMMSGILNSYLATDRRGA